MISLSGSGHFRYRILLATLTGKPVRISDIRSADTNPGLRDYEIRFLHLIEQVTNGSSIEVNYTGTSVLYRPGLVTGGEVTFDCGLDRSIVYFLEPLLCLAPFSKAAFCLTLTGGLTADLVDGGVDVLRNVNLKILQWFGVSGEAEIRIERRGFGPLGGGRVHFFCPILADGGHLQPVQLVDVGRIKRIRGIAASGRVSPQFVNRLIESSRGLLNPFIPDVFIYSDVFKGEEGGKSPGYYLMLVAESTTGALLAADGMAQGAQETAEDVGRRVSKALLKAIKQGGLVDASHQWLLLTLMALTTEDYSEAVLQESLEISEETKSCMNDIKLFLGVSFKIERHQQEIRVGCIGSGISNIGKKTQ